MKVVFFDADGVLQRAHPSCLDTIAAIAPPSISDPCSEIFRAEAPALVGDTTFVDAVTEVLTRWGAQEQLDTVLHAWCEVEPDRAALDLVDDLRDQGVTCYVASNQSRHRASVMSTHLGYARRFDGELYSHDLRVAKPAPQFFERALTVTDTEPAAAVFVDDSAPNTSAAASTGMTAICVDPDASASVWIDHPRQICLS